MLPYKCKVGQQKFGIVEFLESFKLADSSIAHVCLHGFVHLMILATSHFGVTHSICQIAQFKSLPTTN